MHITFRPLSKSDLQLLHTWLNIDFVSKWYDKRKFVYDDIEASLSHGHSVRDKVSGFIVMLDDRPIGYIHLFYIDKYPEYASCVQVRKGTVGLDVLIGDKEYIHKGIGKDIVDQFLRKHVFQTDGIISCIAGPSPEDTSMIRVFEKAGFTHLKRVTCSGQTESENIMIRKKSNEKVVFSAS